jgi:hypothetical protein
VATFEQMHSLSRYYGWSDLMKKHFIQVSQEIKSEVGNIDLALAQAYMCYWYGGLYVVIEGYEDLKIADPAIDGLLASGNKRLLKCFRHGVFHYQRRYFDKRFMNFMTKGENVIQWVESLHREFDRLFAAHSTALTPRARPGAKG